MRLFLECKPDETLAVALGVPRRAIVHSHGKGRVSKSLSRNSGVVGMVDEDPGSAEPTTLSKFTEVSAQHDVRLREEKARNNRLVVICPRLEPWLVKTAKAAGVRMEDSGLSENVQVLDSVINHRLSSLKRLLNALLAASSPRMLHLKALLLSETKR
jgi:hypothetical protein